MWRFFNDVFDLGVKDERALTIINFFVFFHLILFFLLLGWVIYTAMRGEKEAFNDQVDKMKNKAESKKSNWRTQLAWLNDSILDYKMAADEVEKESQITSGWTHPNRPTSKAMGFKKQWMIWKESVSCSKHNKALRVVSWWTTMLKSSLKPSPNVMDGELNNGQ